MHLFFTFYLKLSHSWGSSVRYDWREKSYGKRSRNACFTVKVYFFLKFLLLNFISKLLLWCTQSRAFLCQTNQKHPLKLKMLKKKQHYIKYFQKKLMWGFFIPKFHFSWYSWFFLTLSYFSKEHCFSTLIVFFTTLNKTNHP